MTQNISGNTKSSLTLNTQMCRGGREHQGNCIGARLHNFNSSASMIQESQTIEVQLSCYLIEVVLIVVKVAEVVEATVIITQY